MKKQMILAVAIATTVTLTACTDPNDPNRKAKTGAILGAAAGAVLGHQISHGSGAYVGAAVGALAGGGAGHYMDNQQREFEQALAAEQAAHQLEIERMRDDSLRLTLDSEISFDFDSATIKGGFQDSLSRLANVISKYDQTVVHIIGHTDSVGNDDYNQRLSERRAESVARYLMSSGVTAGRLHTEGRGEREPRSTNNTEAGRQLNRRVEIFIKPIVEGNEQKAHESPRYY
jgi:outer membrane protein OmpA-like peptidoglycan-associated protein